jgi:hypothetical protein
MQSLGQQRPTISGTPLTPAELARLGVFGKFSPAPRAYNRSGGWAQTYRIVNSHGYVESGNTNRGYLRVERIPSEARGSFRLAVEQKVLQADGSVHAQAAEIRCAANAVATLIEWTLASRFLDLSGSEITELTLDEQGRLPDYDGGPAGKEPKRAGAPPSLVTADWCLFEAVQRLPFDSRAARRFDLIEGLSVARRAQRIAYRGKGDIVDGLGATHWFQQTGSGMLPYDYWLDGQHRLVLAVTFSRAYILDESAVGGFEQSVLNARERLQRRGGDD